MTQPLLAPKTMPVTVITGFLGAGKTTLLNHLLSQPAHETYAVIINEFGEAGIDDKLVATQVDEEIFEMNNGCICCTVRGDLIRIVNRLLKRRDKFAGILIETTGLASPAPVAQTFFADADVRANTYLDSMICVVDASQIIHQLQDFSEAREQVMFADTLLLNKTDLVTPEVLAEIQAELQQMNPLAKLHVVERGKLDWQVLFGQKAFDLEHILQLEPRFLESAETGLAHGHNDAIRSLSITTAKPLDANRFDDWMCDLLRTQGGNLLRTKGVLNIEGEIKRYVFQAVHMMSEGMFTKAWQPEEKRTSTLVLIGKNLDFSALKAGFLSCVA
jgi:G3E family GTPase